MITSHNLLSRFTLAVFCGFAVACTSSEGETGTDGSTDGTTDGTVDSAGGDVTQNTDTEAPADDTAVTDGSDGIPADTVTTDDADDDVTASDDTSPPDDASAPDDTGPPEDTAQCDDSCEGIQCGENACGTVCGECLEGEEICVAGSCITPQPGSCQGICGVEFDPTLECQCAESCFGFGDCCPDVCVACPATFFQCGDVEGASCDGRCNTPYDPAQPCQCNEKCVEFGNCCPDLCDVCDASLYPNPDEICPVCVPQCVGKACGDDGCGGTCGDCPEGWICSDIGGCELAPCVPSCDGKNCGDDGCGDTCGPCEAPNTCENGQCVPPACVPQCTDKDCGDDGCGDVCGTCSEGSECVSGTCESIDPCDAAPNGCACLASKCQPSGAAALCAGVSEGCQQAMATDYQTNGCKTCNAFTFPGLTAFCSSQACASDRQNVELTAPAICDSACFCTPSCNGKTCGDNGCGGSCGTCAAGKSCSAGSCVDSCSLPTDRPLFCACSSNTQCDSDACISVNDKSMCTHQCTKDSDCEAGSGCKFTVSVGGFTFKYCTP